MILGSSWEFEKSSNTEIIERPSDNVEMPQASHIFSSSFSLIVFNHFYFKLMKELPDLQEKIREPPFSYIYSIKARALIHAHLSRLPLPLETLNKGQLN